MQLHLLTYLAEIIESPREFYEICSASVLEHGGLKALEQFELALSLSGIYFD